MVRIAIPEPTSTDAEYNARSLQPYLDALRAAGAEPVIVPLYDTQTRVAKCLADVQGVLLPGSRFDVDPERYGETRRPECGESDPARAAVDELFLQDAFNLCKPILAICHGMQTLNVWLNGTLVQDLEADLKTTVNHRPGREITEAHPVQLTAGSRLQNLAAATEGGMPNVNSSHHQAVRRPGDNLSVTAISPADGVIEAIELNDPDHFVVGVQWHPERTYALNPLSQAIFESFVNAAGNWRLPVIERSAGRL